MQKNSLQIRTVDSIIILTIEQEFSWGTINDHKENKMIVVTYDDGDVSFCENENELHTELGRRIRLGLSTNYKINKG